MSDPTHEQHPDWCDRELCSAGREGHHLSRAVAVNPGYGNDSALIELWLQQFVTTDGEAHTHVWLNLVVDEEDNPYGFTLDTIAHLIRSLREMLERAGAVI